jgi:hypothetical protein
MKITLKMYLRKRAPRKRFVDGSAVKYIPLALVVS